MFSVYMYIELCGCGSSKSSISSIARLYWDILVNKADWGEARNAPSFSRVAYYGVFVLFPVCAACAGLVWRT